MKKILSILCLIVLLSSQNISADEISLTNALLIGKDFLSTKNKQDFSLRQAPAISDEYQLAYTAKKEGKTCYYVFNRGGGGYVIVSADTRTVAPVLGYSMTGYFSYEELGDNAKYWMDSYATQIEALDSLPSNKTKSSRIAPGKNVEPLLGETAWDQEDPYNLLCPEIDGIQCATGCVATAMAQIMYYHKWPERGQGHISYNTFGTAIHIEADLSESVYRWDKMLPIYDSNATDEAKMAVALLMRDCGYSVSMDYDIYESGAVTNQAQQWVKNFDYDKGVRVLWREFFDDEEWNQILITEIDNGRPVNYEGAYNGGHSFVCDGYDADGYFHFNFGWSGNSDGYYLSSANLFPLSQSIICGIEKNHGGESVFDFLSTSNFIYIEDNDLGNHFFLGNASMNNSGEFSEDSVDYNFARTALGVENIETGEVKYFESIDYLLSPYGRNIDIYDEIEGIGDGLYKVWPVARNEGMQGPWIKCHFRKDCTQQYVKLEVKNGIKYYTNEYLDVVPKGMAYVDGLYYFIDNNDKTATLTVTNNMRGMYRGEINIPGTICVNDVKYTVTAIDDETFTGCRWITIKIPATIEKIGYRAFYDVYLENGITFEEGSNLNYIDDYAFSFIQSWITIKIPDKVTHIGNRAFSNIGDLKSIYIPSSVKEIGEYAFNFYDTVKDVFVYWDEPLDINRNVFRGSDLSRITLNVPKGTKELYEQCEPWSQFNIHDGNDWTEEEVTIDNIQYLIRKPDMTAKATMLNENLEPELIFPEYISYDGNDYRVTAIEDWTAHRDYISLTSVFIPKSIKSLGGYAFRFQDELANIQFEDNSELSEIGAFCFDNCNSLESIKLPQNLEYISVFAFSQCSSLKEIDLPISVKLIAQSAFENCPSLKDVTVHWQTPLIIHTWAFEGNDYSQMRLHVPEGTKELYEKTGPWSFFGQIIEDAEANGVIEIASDEVSIMNTAGGIKIIGDYNNVSIYTATGSIVFDAHTSDIIPLQNGMYIINVDGHSFKILVK